ncbi:hypothetical protein [Aridibaculum aurantiacum]|uniref:hypothetical protein n=1 Tax=Aridibaculum aurantiacum TaxID=2810307 RepID=UPI001A96E7D2|nr:hypothetical protein [Aridibaculum aurantiacum]
MENLESKFAHIPGWGIDANPENDPTYPMKEWNGDDHKRLNYERPPQQPVDIEVLHSNERPTVSAVFGTSTPPSGLSGMIRRQAFKYGEGSWGHWLPLILADRINVWEGMIDDLLHGHFPNVVKERGWKAEWEHNRKGMLTNAAIAAAATAAVTAFFVIRSRTKHSK